ncbi:MAG: precorrin-2 C(20)-methyltransferase [Treponema sp.]|nr:precorrin-2 C(20)-methyltransferase [Treponema sp.]
MEKGIFYPVSTGPGSAEMLTLQAVRILKDCEIIFFPESEKNTLALDSISQISGLDLSKKTLIPCHFSMTADKEKSAAEYEKIARECQSFLNKGKSVAMLSIGDVTLYSTAARTAILIQSQGFDVKFIPGVNSFSAAASSALISLCEKDEKLTIIPGDAFYTEGKLEGALKDDGKKVLMKMGRHLREIISIIEEYKLIQNAILVQKASLPEEKIFRGKEILLMTEDDFEGAYLSVMIVG